MDDERLFERLGLKEYEARALSELFSLGRTTAPNLAEATGIPKARIYGVLDSLADLGFVEEIPDRPKKYQPKSPEEVLERAKENRRQEYKGFVEDVESVRDEFVGTYGELYESASDEITPTEELFHVVDVGEPSERETRRLYHEADEEVKVLTKSFEYLESVESELSDAVGRGVNTRVIFLHPKHLGKENASVQAGKVDKIRDDYPDVGVRYSDELLPWRGTLVDPSMEYESGEAILLVEEKDVPLRMRQAAVTENASFVAGLSRYFDLIWEHESTATDGVEYPEYQN
ncbi:MAG: helix-turn-helix domain-containing protein [Halobacteriales archaeon]|nr:helix-turn-helix domain-containing protein [Halobacteriales archaeon]